MLKKIALTDQSKVKVLKASFVSLLMIAATSAHAELPTWATGIFTSLLSTVADVFTAVGPVIAASIVGFVIIRLVKRGSNKI